MSQLHIGAEAREAETLKLSKTKPKRGRRKESGGGGGEKPTSFLGERREKTKKGKRGPRANIIGLQKSLLPRENPKPETPAL